MYTLFSWIPWVKKHQVSTPAPKTLMLRVLLRKGVGGEEITVPSNPIQKVTREGWNIGEFWCAPAGYFRDMTCPGWVVSLCMETNLVRRGKVHSVGWNGCEEHIETSCLLVRGDILRFDKVWDYKSPPSFTEIAVLG